MLPFHFGVTLWNEYRPSRKIQVSFLTPVCINKFGQVHLLWSFTCRCHSIPQSCGYIFSLLHYLRKTANKQQILKKSFTLKTRVPEARYRRTSEKLVVCGRRKLTPTPSWFAFCFTLHTLFWGLGKAVSNPYKPSGQD